MRSANIIRRKTELDELCMTVKAFVTDGELDECMEAVCRAMELYPHSPEPHNLMGIIMEKKGDHLSAMKHFRAAWALDPSYLPAFYNLNAYGTFYARGRCAFDDSDVPASVKGA